MAVLTLVKRAARGAFQDGRVSRRLLPSSASVNLQHGKKTEFGHLIEYLFDCFNNKHCVKQTKNCKMSTQRDKKRSLESARPKLKENANNTTAGNPLIDNCHDYTVPAWSLPLAEEMTDEFPPLPITPTKSPAPKKAMRSLSEPEVDSEHEQTDVVAKLSALINERSDKLTLQIACIQKTVDFVYGEIKDVKTKVNNLEVKVTRDEKRIDICQQKKSLIWRDTPADGTSDFLEWWRR